MKLNKVYKTYSDNFNVATLQAKGGVMHFIIERPERLYRGMVVLSAVKRGHRTRIVKMKEYRYKDIVPVEGGNE
jgi:hypothetical protein